MVKEPVDHILRPRLPWRSASDPSVTECGYDSGSVKSITREEFFQRLKDMGQQRAALFTCMTCSETARRWRTWDDDPRQALEREINWEGVRAWGRVQDRGRRLFLGQEHSLLAQRGTHAGDRAAAERDQDRENQT